MTDVVLDAAVNPILPTAQLVEATKLITYICKVVECLFEETRDGSVVLECTLNDVTNQDLIKKFISDVQTHALVIQKLSSKGNLFYGYCIDDDDESVEISVSYNVSIDVKFTNSKVQRYVRNEIKFFSIVFIKRGCILESDKSLCSQLRFLNFSDGSPYETLHSTISNAISPFYKSYIRESGRVDR